MEPEVVVAVTLEVVAHLVSSVSRQEIVWEEHQNDLFCGKLDVKNTLTQYLILAVLY